MASRVFITQADSSWRPNQNVSKLPQDLDARRATSTEDELAVKPKTIAWILLVAGILFLVAAVLPLRRGESVNVAFLLLAGALIVLSPVLAKRVGASPDSKPPAA